MWPGSIATGSRKTDRGHWTPMLDWLTIVGLIVFPLLLAANGFFVAAEFALVAVRKTRMQELERKGFKRAALVLQALEHLDRFIAATQLGITLASLGLGLVVETGAASVLVAVF